MINKEPIEHFRRRMREDAEKWYPLEPEEKRAQLIKIRNGYNETSTQIVKINNQLAKLENSLKQSLKINKQLERL